MSDSFHPTSFQNSSYHARQQQHDADETGSTIYTDLMRNLENERMADLVLLSSDGQRVLASKFILGARSPVFRRQLFAGASSPQQRPHSAQPNELQVGYSTPVVQGLTEYCRSDDIRAFVRRLRRSCEAQSVRDLVHLFECAEFYELPGLKHKVCSAATVVCQESPHLAAAIFDQAFNSTAADQISNISLAVIQEAPREALLSCDAAGLEFGVPTFPPGVSHLGVDALRQILQDKKMSCDEIVLLEVLMAWVATHERDGESWANFKNEESPFEVAQKLSQYIDLTKVPPSDLLSIVTDSGLFTDERINRALGEIALLVEKEGTYDLNRRRRDGAGAGANYIYRKKSASERKESPKRKPQTSFSRSLPHPGSSDSQKAKTVADITFETIDVDLAKDLNDISFEANEVDNSEAANSILESVVESAPPPRKNTAKSPPPEDASRPPTKRKYEAASSQQPAKVGFVRKGLNYIADSADKVCATVCYDPRSKPCDQPHTLHMQ